MCSRRGFALAAAMMVLVLLSVLGIAALQSTTLEVRISARDRDARAALYVAEAALEEARYYAARGWGKIDRVVTGQVRVTTPTAGPSGLWDADRYAGFTLADRTGGSFSITSHTSGPGAVISVAAGDPQPGRFVVFREVPGTGDPTVSWVGSDSELRVEDGVWAAGSAAGAWNGWVLWGQDGTPFAVLDSGVTVTPAGVWLRLTADPGAGPYRLSLNPWVSALAAGLTPPGDADGGTPAWDRVFADPSGSEVGRGRVEARTLGPGRFDLSGVGEAVDGRRRVSLALFRAGLPDQRVGDWRVENEM